MLNAYRCQYNGMYMYMYTPSGNKFICVHSIQIGQLINKIPTEIYTILIYIIGSIFD